MLLYAPSGLFLRWGTRIDHRPRLTWERILDCDGLAMRTSRTGSWASVNVLQTDAAPLSLPMFLRR